MACLNHFETSSSFICILLITFQSHKVLWLVFLEASTDFSDSTGVDRELITVLENPGSACKNKVVNYEQNIISKHKIITLSRRMLLLTYVLYWNQQEF